MPDVFQVLKKDHDEVKAVLAQLEKEPNAGTGATAGQLEFRKQAVDKVVIEEARHEAVEQQYFWPAVKQLGPDGLRVAEVGLEQETEAEPILAGLNQASADAPGFEERLTAFISAVRGHIAFEEAHAWPLLRATISADQAELLGEQITQAKKLAPDRPHPPVPGQPGAGKSAEPGGRLRDVATGRDQTPT